MISASTRSSKPQWPTARRRTWPKSVLVSIFCAFSAAHAGCSGGPRARDADRGSAAESPASEAPPPIPKIDVHLHVDPAAGNEALAILAEHDIAVGLNASGGEPGRGLEQSMELARASGGRLLPLCNLRLSLLAAADFETYARSTLERCKVLGAKGLKISKYLGLGLVDDTGELVRVDDPRLDPVFESAGTHGLPVLLHSGDPKAFFEPNTEQNERHDELRVHPDWSFHGTAPNGRPWPTWKALLEQFEARVARHPGTTFVGAHFGNAAEEPERVARMLTRYPNDVIDTAARVPEFGRHPPARMRRFFIEYQDRILFGSDLGVGPSGLMLGSMGERPGTRAESRAFFERHFLYFETERRDMPHPTPIQGRWTVSGIRLPRTVLEKLYHRNAERVFAIQRPTAAPVNN